MILIIDDDIAVTTSLSLLLKSEGFESMTAASGYAALALLNKNTFDLVILDMNFSIDTTGKDGLLLLEKIKTQYPALPVILITGWGTIELAVQGMKLGANDFINKPWQNAHLMQSINTTLNLNSFTETVLTRKKINEKFDFDFLIGENEKFLQILDTIGRVAGTDASVLILGESGTGKELIAEAIHQNSKRQDKSFIKVNLGGISTSLFESEMFGHVRGAFTDARIDRIGRFELAHKGTIFLDEIGELDLSSQVKLLRVLQDRTYEILGSSRTKTVDVRVISATNRNLEQMVTNKTFREDLLYRINLISVQLPSLKERADDIPLLVNHFLKNLREIYQRPDLEVSKEAMKWIKLLPLPGNIRQLKNLVERTVLVSNHDYLGIPDFQSQWQSPAKPSVSNLPDVGSMTLEEIEIRMIKQAMKFHHGKVIAVAKSLGLTRSALYRRLDKYQIPFNDMNDPE